MKRPVILSVMAVLLTSLCLVCGGCEERELCYDHSHYVTVAVEFDWSLAPEADPATMVVWFFPVDGSQGRRFELAGDGDVSRSGFNSEVRMPAGTYTMVCHNGSTEYNVERGATADSYDITTYDVGVLSALNRSEAAPRPDDTEAQAVRSQSSRLYAHTLDEPFVIDPSAGKAHKVVFTPVASSVTCDVVITEVENMRTDIEISAILTGVSEAWHPATMSPSDVAVTVPFALERCGSDCLRGRVEIFGTPSDGSHKLRVYTTNKYYYDYDVTDQLKDQAGKSRIELKVSGLKIHNTEGSGMSPGVSDWGDEEDVPIRM